MKFSGFSFVSANVSLHVGWLFGWLVTSLLSYAGGGFHVGAAKRVLPT
jgi:hypothetical protein